MFMRRLALLVWLIFIAGGTQLPASSSPESGMTPER